MVKQNQQQQPPWQLPDLSKTSSEQEPPWATWWQCPEGQAANTWIPANMEEVLAGNLEAPKPTIAPREDGICLLYKGETHAFNGESESGKSLIAQAIAASIISQGDDVLYLDFESNKRAVTRRLIDIGTHKEDIVKHFAYVSPDSPHNNRNIDGKPTSNNLGMASEVFEQVAQFPWKLVVIDGVEAALSLYAADSNSSTDVWAWQRALPMELAESSGAAVVLIDHVVKNKDARGRFAVGSQAKLGAITGVTYLIEPISQIGKGLEGEVKILLAKDRLGDLRQHCIPERENLSRITTVNIDSTRPDGPIIFTFRTPIDDKGNFRPTAMMEKLSKFIEEQNKRGNYPQQGAVTDYLKDVGVKGRTTTKIKALQILIDEGYVRADRKGQARLHTSLKPYRQEGDPLSDRCKPQPKLVEQQE